MSESVSINPAWPVRRLEPLTLEVGPCAWRASMFAESAHAAYVKAHPSLIVIEPEDDDEVLAQVALHASAMPVLIRMNEPAFVRRLEGLVRQRIETLGRSRAEIVVVNVEDTAELKSGGLLQSLFAMREQKLIDHVGLATDDVLAAEWMAKHTAARVLMYPFSLEDQQARYRLLPAVEELGQVSIASEVTPVDGPGLAFAMGVGSMVLPVCDQPLPAQVEASTGQDVENLWRAYQASHQPPPALARSRPPE